MRFGPIKLMATAWLAANLFFAASGGWPTPLSTPRQHFRLLRQGWNPVSHTDFPALVVHFRFPRVRSFSFASAPPARHITGSDQSGSDLIRSRDQFPGRSFFCATCRRFAQGRAIGATTGLRSPSFVAPLQG